MAGAGGVSGSNVSSFLQNQPLDAFFLSGSSPPPFLGSRSMVSFEDVNHVNGSARSLFRSFDHDDVAEDDLDDYFHQPGKKRRLTVNQVQFLEKSFEVENKLEPERKVQLAKDIGLQPRQVAIWFQNRRARWKTKQLEKDYEVLLASYDTLKADFDGLLAEKENLKSEVDLLKNKLDVKGNDSSEPSDTEKNFVELPITSTVDSPSEAEVSKASIAASKQEDNISSAKSDIFDSDSPPHYTDVVRSPLLETGDSSYAFEQDQSDLSQDEDDNLTVSLLQTPCLFPKLEHTTYSEPPASFEDNAFWSWPY